MASPEYEHSINTILGNAQIVIPEGGVHEKLRTAEEENRQLRIKMGFDPTSPDLHLGHAVSMQQLRRFQEIGHLPVVIIGDYTGRIGDPSGRSKSRPLAGPEELSRNAETYIDQLGKVLDTSRIEVHRNSEWLEGLSLNDTIHLLAQGTLSQVISREDFRKRLDSGSPVGLHEIVYPFLQGMDSVAVEADIELGGVDQLYATQAGRLLQGNRGISPQTIVLMPLLRGLDGHNKMSKSLNNYIGLSDEPRDMFGKVMSIPDTLIEEYLRLASTFSAEQIDNMLASLGQGQNPMEIKLRLAHNITSTYHDEGHANDAQEFFGRQFCRKSSAEKEFTEVEAPEGADDAVSLIVALGVVDSNSKARRLIEQGAVKVNGAKVSLLGEQLDILNGFRIQIGKRHFYEVKGSQDQGV